MSAHRTRVVLAALALAVALLAGACSTKTLDVEATGTTTTTNRADASATTTSTQLRASTSTTSTTSTIAGPGPAGVPGDATASGSTPCPSLEELSALGESMGETPSTDSVIAAFDLLGGYVPADLADDYALMRDALVEFLQAVDAAGGWEADAPLPGTEARVMAALEALSSPDVQAASARVEAHFVQACPWLEDAFAGTDGLLDGAPN